MKTWNFLESITGDITVFTKIDDAGNIVIVIVYMDDLSILASTLMLIVEFKAWIASVYKFSNVGKITHFLGLRVLRDHETRTISIDQQHYLLGVGHCCAWQVQVQEVKKIHEKEILPSTYFTRYVTCQ
jgi:hypothetical protein